MVLMRGSIGPRKEHCANRYVERASGGEHTSHSVRIIRYAARFVNLKVCIGEDDIHFSGDRHYLGPGRLCWRSFSGKSDVRKETSHAQRPNPPCSLTASTHSAR